MKTEYLFVALGGLLAVWSQVFLGDDAIVLRVVLTIVGVAIAGSAYEIAKGLKKAKKEDK